MKLEEYLKSYNGTKAFYHVVENSPSHVRLLLQIGLDEDSNRALYEEIQRTTFENSNPNIFVCNTEEMDYIEIGGDKIIDISVLSLYEEACKKQFYNEIEKSDKIRKMLLNKFEDKIMPFLNEFKKQEEVSGLMLRGDLVDSKRYPNEWSGIDITLLTNFWHYEDKKKDKVLRVLGKCPGTVFYSFWNFDFERPNFYGDSVKLAENLGDFAVFYDFVSLPSFIKTSESIKFNNFLYFKRNYSLARIIYEKNDSCKNYINIMTR